MAMKLKANWAGRMADKVMHYADKFPEVDKRMRLTNPRLEVMDLCGKSLWSAVRQHVCNIEKGPKQTPITL